VTTTTSQLPPWEPAHKIPKRSIPYAIMQCKDGTIAPGKYSELNHVWLAWNGKTHIDVEVLRYIDLGLLIPEVRQKAGVRQEP
jgi:hypothetical protein